MTIAVPAAAVILVAFFAAFGSLDGAVTGGLAQPPSDDGWGAIADRESARNGEGLAALRSLAPPSTNEDKRRVLTTATGASEQRLLQTPPPQVFYGDTSTAPYTTANPDCKDGSFFCSNGCRSLWYSVLGRDYITASSCGAANYDQVIHVFKGSSCTSLTCFGTNARQRDVIVRRVKYDTHRTGFVSAFPQPRSAQQLLRRTPRPRLGRLANHGGDCVSRHGDGVRR